MTQRGSENPLFSLWEAGPINEARWPKIGMLTLDSWRRRLGRCFSPGAEPSNWSGDVDIPMLIQPVLVGFDGERAHQLQAALAIGENGHDMSLALPPR